jgi:hypothetical protein
VDGGTDVKSVWRPGSEISFTGILHGHAYRGKRTILACDVERLLRYDHWSSVSGRDSTRTRTVATLTLTPEGPDTRLEVRHDNLAGMAAFGHARFFWRNALQDVKSIVERNPAQPCWLWMTNRMLKAQIGIADALPVCLLLALRQDTGYLSVEDKGAFGRRPSRARRAHSICSSSRPSN